jgi:hypothetical protein
VISVFSLVCLSYGSKELPSIYTVVSNQGNLHQEARRLQGMIGNPTKQEFAGMVCE